MSIKTQKILRFIPFIQLVCFFVWAISCSKTIIRFKYIAKWMIILLVVIFCLAIPSVVVQYLSWDKISYFLEPILYYCRMTAVACIAVKAQESIKISDDGSKN